MWPNSLMPPNIVICPVSVDSIGWALVSSSGVNLNSFTSAIFPTANKAMFVPFTVSKTFTARNMFVLNGAAVSGNFDIGVYTSDFTQLWHSGSTAQVNINTMQSVAISGGLQLGPGLYYMALAMDNIVGTFFRTAPTNQNWIAANYGIAEKITSFPLPATVSPVTVTVAFIPLIAITSRSVV